MKNKGFTLAEILIATAISTLIATILLGLFLAGRNSWLTSSVSVDLQQQTRRAMDAMVWELLQTSAGQVQIADCDNYNNSSVPQTSCTGDIITFRLPVASSENDIVDTIYKLDGSIKWGDIDSEVAMPIEERNINFFVEAAPSNKLVRRSWEVATCFLSGTPILMADHTFKPIEKIKLGDEIMAFDEQTKLPVKDKVSQFFEHTAKQYLIINGHLKVTPNHTVYSKGKWVTIGSLKIGDALFNSQGKEEPITDIKLVKENVLVYNLEVNPYHNYFAGGYLAHNKGTGLPPTEPTPPGGMGKRLMFYLKNIGLAFAAGPGGAEPFDIVNEHLSSDITRVNFVGLPTGINPTMVQISVHAQKQTLLGTTLSLTLTSKVSLRN